MRTAYVISSPLNGNNKLSKVKLATVYRELSKLRRLFIVAVSKGWLVSSPFTKELSKELIQEGDETLSAMPIRELSDDAQRVMTVRSRQRSNFAIYSQGVFAGRTILRVDRGFQRSIMAKLRIAVITSYAGLPAVKLRRL